MKNTLVLICALWTTQTIMASAFAAPPDTAPAAWMRLGEPDGEEYQGQRYHWLGRGGALRLTIDATPAPGDTLDMLWGAKNDQRGAVITVNGQIVTHEAGGYDGFRWQRLALPEATGDHYDFTLEAALQTQAAFLAALRLARAGTPLEAPLPEALSHRIHVTRGPLYAWIDALAEGGDDPWRKASLHGRQANEALQRCLKFVHGWLAHADPGTGLIPRNLGDSRHFWNARDAAADNYPFMVLTTALTDRAMFEGRMLDILRTETRLTSRIDALPDDYDFNTRGFRHANADLDRLIFEGAEYVKDGLMPITEYLGPSPWSQRMIAIVDSILEHAPHQTPGGPIPSDNVEVNGELMQVLSRLTFMADEPRYLDMACRIADYYLLGDHHPTRNRDRLQLRDHGCELISGLTEVYAACHFLRKEKAAAYREPLHEMLDRILEVGLNEHGLMYDAVNPQTGDVLSSRLSDNWGYNYNGYYTVYLLDGVERYRQATRRAMASLAPHYWEHPWEGLSSDGIADSVEGAINLLNRERDVEGVSEWIDANMARMLLIQRADGVIEGWHGDGNYARTAIMWALWKQQGVTLRPWREDVRLGAVWDGETLRLHIAAEETWQGALVFDTARHRANMRLPFDYPRINQFPEWFTVDGETVYQIEEETADGTAATPARQSLGGDILRGLALEVPAGGERRLIIRPAQGTSAVAP